MVGFIVLIIVTAAFGLGLKKLLEGSPYDRGIMLPFGRFIAIARHFPGTESPEESTEKPKIPPTTISYLQGDFFIGRTALVGLFTLAVKGYMIVRRDPENGSFSFIKKAIDTENPPTALTKTENQMLKALFPGDSKELVIDRHNTARLDDFCAILLTSLDEKFMHRRRDIPKKLLLIGLALSLVGQMAIAASSAFGLTSLALPFWLLLCPALVLFFSAGLYASLRSFYFRPFQHIAERLMVFGIGWFFSMIGWVMGLWVGMMAYGIPLLAAILLVQVITVCAWLLARHPPSHSQNGHGVIAQSIAALACGHGRPSETVALDNELLLLALATGTERIWLSGHFQPMVKETANDPNIMTATDKLVNSQNNDSTENGSGNGPKNSSKSNARKLDQRLLKLFQKIQGLVPVRVGLVRITLPEWLDLSPDGHLEPDALANILGELMLMELAFNLIITRGKRHKLEKHA